MKSSVLKIINPGLLTTIQKSPEQEFPDRTITKSGAFDRFAIKMGNLILKNKADSAGIELTGEGGELEIMNPVTIAVTGGNFDVRRNGKQVQQWCALSVCKGDTISVLASRFGWRCYICVAGGVKERPTPGKRPVRSKNENDRSWHPLKKGDVLTTETSVAFLTELMGRRVREMVLPRLEGERELRIVPLPLYDLLKDESKEVFLSSSYRVSSDSDRVYYRFEGPQLLLKEKASRGSGYGWENLVANDEDSPGLIQVALDGEILCTGPDCLTESDRIPIARLIASDMDRVAQLKPKDHIKFKVVTSEDARLIFDHSMSLITEANILSM